jgi:hypothetical protein
MSLGAFPSSRTRSWEPGLRESQPGSRPARRRVRASCSCTIHLRSRGSILRHQGALEGGIGSSPGSRGIQGARKPSSLGSPKFAQTDSRAALRSESSPAGSNPGSGCPSATQLSARYNQIRFASWRVVSGSVLASPATMLRASHSSVQIARSTMRPSLLSASSSSARPTQRRQPQSSCSTPNMTALHGIRGRRAETYSQLICASPTFGTS